MSKQSGPEWHYWPELKDPGEVCFVPATANFTNFTNVLINNRRVGCLIRRPYYCDRGRWQFTCELPGIEASTDGFPRYYMDETRAKLEITAWLSWRLWERQTP